MTQRLEVHLVGQEGLRAHGVLHREAVVELTAFRPFAEGIKTTARTPGFGRTSLTSSATGSPPQAAMPDHPWMQWCSVICVFLPIARRSSSDSSTGFSTRPYTLSR